MALCPRCRIPLKKHTITTDVEKWEVEVDACTNSCGGVWLQDHDFKADARANLLLDCELYVINRAVKRLKLSKLDETAKCPDCKIPMYRYEWNKTGLEIDQCKKCKGRWFDAGEIQNIADVLRSSS